LTSSEADGEVSVVWSPDSPTCTGAKVAWPSEPDPSDPSESGPVIRARRGMHCSITVVITNTGAQVVHLDTMVAPFIGPRTGGVVTADPPPPADTQSDGLDGVYPLDVDLAAGESATVTMGLGFQEAGCVAGTTRSQGWPSVSFQVLGRTQVRNAANTFIFEQAGPSRACPLWK